jgi:hypothetical protein
MPDVPLLSPREFDASVLHEIARLAMGEVYALERQRWGDADWERIEALLWRAFNAQARQFMLRCEVKIRGTDDAS